MKNINDAFNECEALVSAITEKISGINKSRKKFIVHLFILFMGLRGRYNFLNMERYGNYSEQSYRNNFSGEFDFMAFNIELVKQCCSTHLIVAFDPSYIPKSGKKTEHLGWFWSGTAGKAKKGLEIGGLAVIDIENNTAMSLEAIQTPTAQELKEKGMSLVDHYANVIIDRSKHIEEISIYMAVDGYFAKTNFIDPILQQTSIQIIGKLRTDANLWYPYLELPTGKRGRPKEYVSKIDVNHIDKNSITLCYQEDDKEDSIKVYEGIVYNKMLKRKIKIAYLELWKKNKYTGNYIILFSTDISLEGRLIYLYYKSRYQIEFLFRDAKQHTGLTHCQARDEKKFHFHVNASLSTVSLAKAVYYLLDSPQSAHIKKQKTVFSMSDIKTIYLNKLIVKRIFVNLELDLNQQKINDIYHQSLLFGSINAKAA